LSPSTARCTARRSGAGRRVRQKRGRAVVRKVCRAGFRERDFQRGPVRLHYAEGPPGGSPLVLIPAQMGIWESYQKVLPALSRRFYVFAVDLRGHGRSSWTPGDYSWTSVGADLAAFLAQVVGRPAVVAGNSSGGIVALWLAAHTPEFVAGTILEDAPVFSAELPRFRDRDRFVYRGLEHLVAALGNIENRDLADYFRGQELPTRGGQVRRVPGWFVRFLSGAIRRRQKAHPGEPVDIAWLPGTPRLLLKSLSAFDPDFARAFVDGRFYGDFSHAAALREVRCPLLVLHADWFRHSEYGLVGAMDDRDAARIRELTPQAQYRRIAANHVIHVFRPRAYVEAVTAFMGGLNNVENPPALRRVFA